MRLVGDYFYYAFWGTVGGGALYLLWQINAKLAMLVKLFR